MVHNIVKWPGITRLDSRASDMLEAAGDARLADVVIIGFDEHGEFYFASNKSDGGDVLWLMELTRKRLMELADTEDTGSPGQAG